MEIKFPRGDDDPNTVTIIGAQDNVDECKDHLLNLMEEYMQDIVEEEDMEAYMNPKPFQALLDPGLGGQGQGGSGGQGGQKKEEAGFVVSGAPWAQEAPNMDSAVDFPSMGAMSSAQSAPTTWGPRR